MKTDIIRRAEAYARTTYVTARHSKTNVLITLEVIYWANGRLVMPTSH